MKTNGTRIILVTVFLYLLLVVFTFSTFAQSPPDYSFTSSSLVSGTDRQVGAKYRFNNVKAGVDAFLTITSISSGVTLSNIDGSSGYPEALQPDITVAADTRGYVEMTIDFLVAGTNTPMVQLEVPATCIDVDGTSTIHEFDEIKMMNGYYMYDFLSTELKITTVPGWVLGENIGGVDYPARDTIARSVMFTAVVGSTSQMVIRVGADNAGGSSQTRLRSVYFKKFTYANAFLASNALLAFRGTESNRKVSLNWDLRSEHMIKTITVEKSNNAKDFRSIGEYWLTEAVAQNGFRMTDNELLTSASYYRLRMVAANGQVQYSNVLSFRSAASGNGLRVYPTMVQEQTTLTVTANETAPAVVAVIDLNGRTVMSKNVNLTAGASTLTVDGFSRLTAGTYVIMVKQGTDLYQQKIIKN